MSDAEFNIDNWHQMLIKELTDNITDKGSMPHRARGTSHAIRLHGLAKIMELAKYGQQMKKRLKNKTKLAMAIELRKLADRIENSEQ